MSDGISDGARARSLDDILTTGAGWITEAELQQIGADLRMFERLWHRLRSAAVRLDEVLPRGIADSEMEALRDAVWDRQR